MQVNTCLSRAERSLILVALKQMRLKCEIDRNAYSLIGIDSLESQQALNIARLETLATKLERWEEKFQEAMPEASKR